MTLDINKAFLLLTIVTDKGNTITLPCRTFKFNKKDDEAELTVNSFAKDGVTPCAGVQEYYRRNPLTPVGTELLIKMLLMQGVALIYSTATLMYNEQGELFIPEEE